MAGPIFGKFNTISIKMKINFMHMSMRRRRQRWSCLIKRLIYCNNFLFSTKGNNSSLPGSSGGNRHLVEFRAGRMTMVGKMVHPDTRKGLLYVYQADDGLIHFCWKNRTTNKVEDDLIIFPDDCEFKRVEQCKTGRVYLLKVSDLMSNSTKRWDNFQFIFRFLFCISSSNRHRHVCSFGCKSQKWTKTRNGVAALTKSWTIRPPLIVYRPIAMVVIVVVTETIYLTC